VSRRFVPGRVDYSHPPFSQSARNGGPRIDLSVKTLRHPKAKGTQACVALFGEGRHKAQRLKPELSAAKYGTTEVTTFHNPINLAARP